MRAQTLTAAVTMVMALGIGCSDSSGSGDTLIDTRVADTLRDTRAIDTAQPADTQADTATPIDTTPADTTPPTTFPMGCDGDADCIVACGVGRCVGGRCTFAPGLAGCVIQTADGATGTCVDEQAVEPTTGCLRCAPDITAEGYTGALTLADFETGLTPFEGHTFDDGLARWRVSNRRAVVGQRSAYFGDSNTASYDLGERAWGWLTSPTLAGDVATPLTLNFQLWLDTEETRGFDFLRVLLDRGGNALPVELWHSDDIGGTTYGEFLPIMVPVGAAPGGRLIFEFDTVDGVINGFEGVYLDDVRISADCCLAEVHCDDQNPCTTDTCADGRCGHEVIEGCCLIAEDCDDGDACTEDRCSERGGTCEVTAIQGCCRDDGDCQDGDPCTEDRCPEAGVVCEHLPLCCSKDEECVSSDPCVTGACDGGQCRYAVACCQTEEECDDNDACTADSCVDGRCEYAPKDDAGCCTPDVLTERFEGAALTGWTVSEPRANVGWHLATADDAQSGGGVLYYGHPTLQFYDTGSANKGSATSPAVRVPSDVEVRVVVSALLEVEGSPLKDQLTVEALIGTERVPLMTKVDFGTGAWRTVSADISYLAGQTVRIAISFDTVDQHGNSTRGVVIDDVRVLSSCRPRPCEGDAACTSAATCVSGT